jgi:hypothetical protein
MGTDIHGPFIERKWPEVQRWESIAAVDWGRDYLLFDLISGARHGRQPDTLPESEVPTVPKDERGYIWLDHGRWLEGDCWGHRSITPDQLEEVIRRYAASMERWAKEEPDTYNQGGPRSHEPDPDVLFTLRIARMAEEEGRPVRIGFCFDN